MYLIKKKKKESQDTLTFCTLSQQGNLESLIHRILKRVGILNCCCCCCFLNVYWPIYSYAEKIEAQAGLFCTVEENLFFFADIFDQVQKLNIYESRKVMPESEMPRGRVIHGLSLNNQVDRYTKADCEVCDGVTKDQACARNIYSTVFCIRSFICGSPPQKSYHLPLICSIFGTVGTIRLRHVSNGCRVRVGPVLHTDPYPPHWFWRISSDP